MNLTELSYNIRKALPYVILAILGIFIIFYSVTLVMKLIELNRQQPVRVEAVFGKIKPPAVKNASTSAGLKFTLDTVEGTPVTATDSAQVYYLPPPVARFGYREKVYLIAQSLGFNTDVTRYQLDGEVATLSDNVQTLTVDIRNFNFTYQYLYENDPALFAQAVTPTTQDSQKKAVEFLQKIGRYPEELALGTITTIFYNYDPETKILRQLGKNVDANLVEVDFHRPDLDGHPAVSPTFFNSQNFILMMNTVSGEPKILRAQISFFERSQEQIGYYPIKTGEAAYEDLKAGRAYVVSNPDQRKEIVIKTMKLGYLDPDFYQDYFQPVYMFIGENNFVAYVPAIVEEYLIK